MGKPVIAGTRITVE
ncbi:DUF433 domain-containing protein, partial [Candidatus Bipolaricaulota bacterium]|nr:DUF433 domain-containing protein [Candidatus Bipolaricaulota bacterium]